MPRRNNRRDPGAGYARPPDLPPLPEPGAAPYRDVEREPGAERCPRCGGRWGAAWHAELVPGAWGCRAEPRHPERGE